MARGNAAMGIGMVVVVVAAMIVGAAAAPAPAPSAVDCTSVVLTLSDCLGFVTGTDKTPPKACCTELASVVKSSPQCLCLLFNTTFTQPLGVNVTLAQQLPTKCKVQTPSTSLCALVGIPVPGPVSSSSPVSAPSPAAKTPTSTPGKAPSSSPTPASTTPATTAPSGSSGTPASNSSTSAPASSPNGAHSISYRNVGAAASLLLIASIFLS